MGVMELASPFINILDRHSGHIVSIAVLARLVRGFVTIEEFGRRAVFFLTDQFAILIAFEIEEEGKIVGAHVFSIKSEEIGGFEMAPEDGRNVMEYLAFFNMGKTHRADVVEGLLD